MVSLKGGLIKRYWLTPGLGGRIGGRSMTVERSLTVALRGFVAGSGGTGLDAEVGRLARWGDWCL